MTLCKNCGTREAQLRSDYCEPCETFWLHETTGQSRQQTADAQSSPCVGDRSATGAVKEPITGDVREVRRGTAFDAPQPPSTRRIEFAAPLSPLTHDVFATRPASSWLALGETGRVIFVARTSYNWRLAVVQAVHEIVEAALHRHAGVTQAELDAADLIALSRDAPLTDTAHSCGVVWQTALALRLGVPHHLLARATYGTHTPSPHAGIRQAP